MFVFILTIPQTLPITLPDRLAGILLWLRETIAAYASRHRATAPMVLVVWPYLNRLASRFASLAARVRAGEAMVARAPARLRAAPATPRLRPRPPLALPQGFAWLLRLAPTTVPLRSQVCHWLGDPELAALLAAAPQALRILRPLCWMLGIGPESGQPPGLFAPPAPPPAPARAKPAPQPCEAPSTLPNPPAPQPPPRKRRALPRVPTFRTVLA